MREWTGQNSQRNSQIAGDFRLAFSVLEQPESGRMASSFGTASDFAGVTRNTDWRREERLAERTRIAQELHDTLLQGFFAASMQLHAAVDQLPADCAAVKPQFGDVLQLLDGVLERGRCAVQGLRSPDADGGSLGQAFAAVPDGSGCDANVDFRVVIEGRERELKADLRDEVYRIGCEAIVNALRHSGATEIETEIEYRPTELRMRVRDNGCGIDPSELQWSGHENGGLQEMRGRAERFGGRLRLFSKVGLGTEIELCIPARIAFEQNGVRTAR